MRFAAAATLAAALMVVASTAGAQLQPVQVLEATDSYTVLGNDAFSLRVDKTGKLGDVQAAGVKYLWLGSLYTTPIVPETGKGLRAEQADEGIGPAPALPAPVQRGDYCEVVISYDAAREELYGGEPIYRLTQTVQVHPGGWVRLRYEFDWLRTCVFSNVTLYLALEGEGCGDRGFSADYTDHITGGVFDMQTQSGRIDAIRGQVRSLAVDCEAGLLDIWFDEADKVTAQYWGNNRFAITPEVPGVARNEPMYPGMHSVLQLNIKLPVSE